MSGASEPKTELLRVTSPDQRLDAVMVADARGSSNPELFIVKRGSSTVGVPHALQLIHAEPSVEVEWTSEGLRLTAQSESMRVAPSVGETPITVVSKSDGSEHFLAAGKPTGNMRLSLIRGALGGVLVSCQGWLMGMLFATGTNGQAVSHEYSGTRSILILLAFFIPLGAVVAGLRWVPNLPQLRLGATLFYVVCAFCAGMVSIYPASKLPMLMALPVLVWLYINANAWRRILPLSG